MIGSPLIVRPSASARSRAPAGLPPSLSCAVAGDVDHATAGQDGQGLQQRGAEVDCRREAGAAGHPVALGPFGLLRDGLEVQAAGDQPPCNRDGLAVRLDH